MKGKWVYWLIGIVILLIILDSTGVIQTSLFSTYSGPSGGGGGGGGLG